MARAYKVGIINQRFINLLGLSSSAQMITSNYEKNSFEMIIIIISLTNNFIAEFHGLYLPAVKSYSCQFPFSFWVERMTKGLPTMSNKTLTHK